MASRMQTELWKEPQAIRQVTEAHLCQINLCVPVRVSRCEETAQDQTREMLDLAPQGEHYRGTVI